MKALSEETDPEKASLPFDARRKGFVLGEGAGILALEEYEHAKARGAHIHAEIVGYGNTCDAYHITAPHPQAVGGSQALRLAMQEAGEPHGALYINAHGTGTPMNDKLETLAIKNALGEARAREALISSTKSMTGHMLGAAGGVEAHCQRDGAGRGRFAPHHSPGRARPGMRPQLSAAHGAARAGGDGGFAFAGLWRSQRRNRHQEDIRIR